MNSEDIKIIREYYKKQGKSIDKKYHFYYDETNNNIKYQFKNGKIPNIEDFKSNYILGGIVFLNSISKTKVDELIKKLKLKGELKYKNLHSKKTDTLQNVMNGKNLNAILNFIKNNNIWIHAYSFNNLYDPIIEIVDSISINYSNVDLSIYLKDLLYNFVSKDIKRFLSILNQVNYPNIQGENIRLFCSLLINWLEEQENAENTIICSILKDLSKENELFFLKDNKEKTIIENYSSINIDTCIKYLYSYHIFDEISEIEKEMKKLKLSNFYFINSKDDFFIQISDTIVGLINKFLIFIEHDLTYIVSEIINFNEMQENNFRLLLDIYKNSLDENDMFFTFYEPKYIVAYRNEKIFWLIENYDNIIAQK